jgi:hypothetical protein
LAVVTTQLTVKSGTRPWSVSTAFIACAKVSARTTEPWTLGVPPCIDMYT